ncbi:MAG: glycosyltransferase family 25 protein [Proteobacteria bacterium]|nr:glycosyltransferase family 25 protein [Pseudomonadota bacterium]
MKLFVVNVELATERRRRLERQFESLGLKATFFRALDARKLSEEDYARVDRESRRRLGLWPQADGSIANWISQRRIMREIVDGDTEIAAIFEDDAGLSPELPVVLEALESRPFSFDVVKLNRRSLSRTFIPVELLPTGHRVGRVRYHDYGNEGYVITRDAAQHFLKNTPKMMWEIDQALPRFWENGLNVYYLDPPVVFHDERNDSQIEQFRRISRRKQKDTDAAMVILWRRVSSALVRMVRRHLAFRRLMRGEIGVTPWPPNSDR